MNILVTGGTGFVGRCLVEHLLSCNNNIYLLTRDKGKTNGSFYQDQHINVTQVDISDPKALKELNLKDEKIDATVHLAASVHFYGSKNKLHRANVEGTHNLLQFSKDNNIGKFIFISSIEAMGTISETDIPANEEHHCSPVCTYGSSKLEAEEHVNNFAKENNLEAIILRLGNVYGEGVPSFIVPIANALLRKNRVFRYLHVYKDTYVHPVYVTDIARTIDHILHANSISGIYILSGNEYISIGKLFELIAQSLDCDTKPKETQNNLYGPLSLKIWGEILKMFGKCDLVTYFNSGTKERAHRAYSIDKAKKELEFSPEVSLKQGVEKTLNWAKAQNLLKEV